jgi:hypothetical protein
MYVARLSSAGNYLWSRSFGDGSEQEFTSLAVAQSGDVVLSGHSEGAVDLGGGVLGGGGSTDLILVKLDPMGVHRWSKAFGDGSAQQGQAVAITPEGSVLLGGDAQGVVNVGTGDLPPVGGVDVLLARFAP